ncbi:TadE family protein [Pigmentiphaga sp.]|uniref:TadE/TadG family type IV pilus assembly protein n=1 Tax=Pigmentiphaga sp. TaxID=1977564 RepID=UPI0025E5E69B|nr:TadE family protein [Pigmentiphaga sp.]
MPSSLSQRGAAMAEFTVVAIPLLFAGLGAFETGRWLVVRQAVGYALFEAARAGTVANADPAAIAQAFERALSPALGIRAMQGPNDQRSAVRARMAHWTRVHGLRMARIEQLNPAPASFQDFPARRAAEPRELDYDHQRLRHDTVYRSRYRGGVGPRSGQTLFDANTLVLRLTYLHAPYLPGMRTLLRSLADASETDDHVRQARKAGLLVIRREIAMPMQSAAREHGRSRDLLGP